VVFVVNENKQYKLVADTTRNEINIKDNTNKFTNHKQQQQLA